MICHETISIAQSSSDVFQSVTRSLFFTVVLLAGRLNPARAQSALDGFDPNANGVVRAAVVQPDGKILIGGDFTMVSLNGRASTATRNYIARRERHEQRCDQCRQRCSTLLSTAQP